MTSLKAKKNLLETIYMKKGTLGVESPGVPIINYVLTISLEDGIVSGIVEIIKSSGVNNVRFNVKGDIRTAGYEGITKIVNLYGEYMISVRPPAIGTYQQKFKAYLDFDDDWKGVGGFTYEGQIVNDLILTPAS